ncbi:MAG: membrane protein insertase YidC [Pseudomonadales bacterium]|nr:membrane protein insertase YidC [Pseudomonadales bacterium]
MESTVRYTLIAGLILVSWYLVYLWQQDYGHTSVAQLPPVTSQSITELSSKPIALIDNDVITPNIEIDDNSLAEDLPSLEANQEIPTIESSNLPLTNNLVSVLTDTLDIRIDTVGGDIVYAGLVKYPLTIDNPDIPFTLLNRNESQIYIAESGVVGKSGSDLDSGKKNARPHYQSSEINYEMTADTLVVPLTYTSPNGLVTRKIFTFSKGSYVVKVQFELNNQSNDPWLGRFYARLRRDNQVDPGVNKTVGMGMPTYLGTAFWRPDEKYNKLDFEDIEDAADKKQRALDEKIKGGWIAIIQHYFVSAWVPDVNETHLYQTSVNSRGEYIIGLASPTLTVEAFDKQTISSQLYLGPKLQSDLEALSDGLNLSVDYGFLFFISDILFSVMQYIHSVVDNWGVAIILLTVLVKAFFFPLSAASFKSMANMRRVQPDLLRIREQYAEDKQRLSQEMMALYKKEKINPLGGCLPMLVQMPVFIALYWALMESVELRQADFALWIHDLSVMDPYFILPLLMGASMFFQQSLNPAPPDPMQAKVMKFMPIIFTFFFLFFPAGLVLYWLTNNVLSIAQQWYITKRIENAAK